MTSSVSICSNALIRLGDKPISSFQDATDAATACSNLYFEVRDTLLRAHPWNCATKRVLLSPTTVAPAFDYAYQFPLPADWLRTIQVGSRQCAPDYMTEGKVLLCDLPSLPLVYIFRNTVESTWDTAFVDVVTAAMASALAYSITKSAAMMQAMDAKFQQTFKIAKSVNGQDDPDQTLGDFPLIASRIGGYRMVPGR